jgi:hypothetical protein
MNRLKFIAAWTFSAASLVHAEPSVIIQNKNYESGTVANEWAQYVLTTSGNVTVKSGSNVNFSAGSITLYPGFNVESGATFKALVSNSPSYNPGGYYSAITPTLSLIAGDQQYGQIGQFNLLAFEIAIWNAAGTAPLVNAPVLITVSSGGGWLSATNGSGAVLTKTLQLNTDADGTIHAYYQQGSSEYVVSSIQVIAGNQTWQFTTYSYATTGANTDTDGDGISNAAETALGLNTTQVTQTAPAATFGLSVFTP